MVLPLHHNLRKSRRFGQVALTALLIGIGGAAIATMPLGNMAFADKGGNGGGHGHGGDHGGDHGGGNGGGQGHGGGQGGSGGPGNSDKAGKGSTDDTADTADDSSSDDDSLTAHGLGKLNGFFHASPNALANASPNSSIGRISHTFKDALSDFAAANESTDDTTGTTDTTADGTTPPTGPSVNDLGAILAGATNKTVTASQVKAIIDRLAEQNPDDTSLGGLADSVDDATCQDIADAANGTKSDETTSDDSTDDGTDTSADTSSDGTDTGTTTTSSTVVTTTN
jgi:hypothetical protein